MTAVWSFFPLTTLPAPLDIVWCRFPFVEAPDRPAKARPALVRRTLLDEADQPFLEVAYGTSKLRTQDRPHDFTVQNFNDLYEAGLAQATRFSLSRCVILPWAEEWFCPATEDFPSPVMGHLSLRSQEFLRLLVATRRAAGID